MQLQRRRHAGISKNHYILLLSESILKFGCNSIKFNSAIDNISVKVTYQYNGCTEKVNMISAVYRIFSSSSSSNRRTFTDISLFCSGPSRKEKIFIQHISNYAE
jgi:hypothetical protein